MSCRSRPRILFITGTDTGVGKTALSALLLLHLRRRGFPAYALKPFCSGERADAELVCAIQNGALDLDEINPFFFREPVAPFVAARAQNRAIPRAAVLRHIAKVRSKLGNFSHLLIEGAGGLLAPLGKDYTALDLILDLKCEVVVVAANKLGTINHTALTVSALANAGVAHQAGARSTHRLNHRAGLRPLLKSPPDRSGARARITGIVLMNTSPGDPSSASNARILRQILAPVRVSRIPFLSEKPASLEAVARSEKNLKKTLAGIFE